MSVLGWIVLGLIAGFIASKVEIARAQVASSTLSSGWLVRLLAVGCFSLLAIPA